MQRVLTLIGLAISISACHAVETDIVHLQGLLPNSLVYVDGKPVEVNNNAITLSFGTHQLQVEQYEVPKPNQAVDFSSNNQLPNLTGVFFFRDCVSVQKFGTPDVTIKPLPVYPSNITSQLPDWNYGPLGPSGRAGLAANPERKINQDEAITLLREGISSRLADSESRCQMLELEFRRYTSSAWQTKVVAYGANRSTSFYCMPGPTGRVGHTGVSGDARRLKSEQGQLLLNEVLKKLGFDELNEQKAKATTHLRNLQEQRKQDFNPNCQNYSALEVYTARWKNHLDAEYFKFHFVSRSGLIPAKPSDFSAEGAMGPSGPDGDLPRGQENVVTFSDEQVQAMLGNLMADDSIRRKIENLRQRFSKL